MVPGDMLDRYLQDEQVSGNAALNDYSLSMNRSILNRSWQILFLILGIFNVIWAAGSILNLDNSALQALSVQLGASKEPHFLRLYYKDQEQIRLTNVSEGLHQFKHPICIDRSTKMPDHSVDILYATSDTGSAISSVQLLSSIHWYRRAALQPRRNFLMRSKVHSTLHPPWQTMVDTIAGDLIVGTALIVTAGCGAWNQPRLAKFFVHLHISLLSLTKFLSAAAYISDGCEQESCLAASHCALWLFTSAVIARAESRFVPAGIALAGLWLGCIVAHDCLLLGDCAQLLTSPPITALGICALSSILLLLHWHARRRAARSAEADRVLYDAAWERLRREEPDAVGLIVAVIAGRRNALLAAPPARQLARSHTGPSLAGGSVLLRTVSGLLGAEKERATDETTVRTEGGELIPVSSLDQLYAQVRD